MRLLAKLPASKSKFSRESTELVREKTREKLNASKDTLQGQASSVKPAILRQAISKVKVSPLLAPLAGTTKQHKEKVQVVVSSSDSEEEDAEKPHSDKEKGSADEEEVAESKAPRIQISESENFTESFSGILFVWRCTVYLTLS